MTTGSEETIAESVKAASEAYYAANPNIRNRNSRPNQKAPSAELQHQSSPNEAVKMSVVEEDDNREVYSYGTADAEDETKEPCEVSAGDVDAPLTDKHSTTASRATPGTGATSRAGSRTFGSTMLSSKNSPSFNPPDQTFNDVVGSLAFRLPRMF